MELLIRCSSYENNKQCSEPAQLIMIDDNSLLCFTCALDLRRVGGVEQVLKYMARPLKQRNGMEEPYLGRANGDIHKPVIDLDVAKQMVKDKVITHKQLANIMKRIVVGKQVRDNNLN